ncbi:MAG TPA: URC4/urg3 family protein [Geminicoccaceae bacterium]|nr:URC4/urg3 family protein [Geminicoccaceae bacterium]
MASFENPAAAIAWLRSPAAIRARAGLILAAAERDELKHFKLVPSRLDPAADYVIETIRSNYPDLRIPYHSRWRHFYAGGQDRAAALRAGLPPEELARTRFDLVVTSVLLDAGAGDAWRYHEPGTAKTFARSEGLALASLDLFRSGALSGDPSRPLRADAGALLRLDERTLGDAFQVSGKNPLVGLAGRCRLLNRVGEALLAKPEIFGTDQPRIGDLFDYLARQAKDARLPASAILAAVLEGLGEIWPGRIELAGVNLGDVGRHPAAATDDLTSELVPFHKLSQWLAYSLIEPLEDAGITVTDLDQLTALAEYRNGGLLIDLRVLRPKHDGVLGVAHPGGSEVVVEWRALTVALIDRLAERIRARLGLAAAELPLAKILEGGTWAAGRRIARELRPGGGPPLQLMSDGTLF